VNNFQNLLNNFEKRIELAKKMIYNIDIK